MKAAAFQSKSTQVNGHIIAHNMKAMFPQNKNSNECPDVKTYK